MLSLTRHPNYEIMFIAYWAKRLNILIQSFKERKLCRAQVCNEVPWSISCTNLYLFNKHQEVHELFEVI